MRQQRQMHARRNPNSRLGFGCVTLLSLLAAVGAIAITLAYTNLSRGLPSLEALPALLNPPDGVLRQPTRIYDSSGKHVLLTLENPAARDSQYLPLEGTSADGSSGDQFLPSSLISATIATDDPTFWHNWGFTLAGIQQGSHPTIAQRLVSDLLLWDEKPGLQKALRERLLAAQITGRFGKEKVLEWYLNSAYYGHLAYGADEAAHVYFNKSASQLSLGEAAVLAAVAQAPAINPLDAPQAARERQDNVIQRMQDLGLIQADQADQARQESLNFSQETASIPNPAPAFTNLVLEQVQTQIDRARLERGGLKIITTLDYDLQMQAGCATATQLARLQATQDEPAAFDGSECQAARLLPTLAGGDPSKLPADIGANMVILDPQTGKILAMVGDTSPGSDPAHLPGHPPGSLLTPFIYLTAFTRGMGPASLVWDTPSETIPASLQNFDGIYHGPMRLRVALSNDYLVPAVKVLDQIGSENAWRTAQQLGLTTFEPPSNGPSGLPLQGGEMTLLEASQAFGVLANQGVLVGTDENNSDLSDEPPPLYAQAVERVVDDKGQTLLDWGVHQSRPVISPQLSYLMTNVLSDEAARWPSLGHPNALEIGRPAAAKIGRAISQPDSWTIGYTPQLVVGVWVGPTRIEAANTDSELLDGENRQTSNAAAALWHAMIQYASSELPPQGWNMPAGVSSLVVCDPSGLLPTADCPTTVNEVFLNGNEPNQPDNLYRRFEINRETGRLATVFTPADLVEERVYMLFPPEARDWASQAGLATPPEAYDVISVPSSSSADVQISTPGMFSYVKGKVTIRGSAGGSGFDFARVQVGKGLNPQQWLQVGQDLTQPVNDGDLAAWDTSGLNGLFAVQLIVVRQDKSIDSAIIQVTVDNHPPDVKILYPAAGQELSLSPARIVTFQADINDDLAMSHADFYVDSELVGTLTQAPFAFPWQAQKGPHTLKVVATDQAGNQSEAVSEFIVK
jgi:membrane peptidoglycan carboxypeptidase